ncbi:MAG: MFS transporter [Candidatus Caldarchaeum sp.]
MNKKVLVYLSLLSVLLAGHMIIPLIGLYAAVVLGAAPFVIGFIYGVATITAFAYRLPSAWLTSKIGVRRTMAVGMFSTTLACVVYGLSTSPIQMVVGSFLRGLGSAFFFPTALSTVYEEAGGDGRDAKNLGYMLTAPAMGMTLGPVVGAAVLSVSNHQTTFFTAAAISSAGLVGMLSVRDYEQTKASIKPASVLERRFLFLLASRFFINYITGTVAAFVPLMANMVLGYAEPVVMLLFTAGAVANLSSRIVMGAFSSRLGAHNYLLMGSLTLSMSALILSLLNEGLTWVGMVAYGMGMGVFVLGSVYITGRLLPPEARTMGFAMLTLAIDVGSSAGNFFSGMVLTLAGFREVFLVAALSGFTGAAVDLISRRWPLPSERQGPASSA